MLSTKLFTKTLTAPVSLAQTKSVRFASNTNFKGAQQFNQPEQKSFFQMMKEKLFGKDDKPNTDKSPSSSFDTNEAEFTAGNPSAARSEELYNENKKKIPGDNAPNADSWGTKNYKSFGKQKRAEDNTPPPSETGFSG